MPTDNPAIPRVIRESATFFDCLGSPSRLNLISLLAAEGEMFVGQMRERTGYPPLSLFRQLKILQANKLVEVRREGTTRFYSLVGGFEGVADRVQAAVDLIRKSSPKSPKAKRSAN
jgi:DNA-binding transcriptional ArsR family regulator